MDDHEKRDAEDKGGIKKLPLKISGHKAGAAGKESTKSVKHKQRGREEPKHKKKPTGRQGGRLDIKQSKKRQREEAESNRTSELLADGRPRCKRSDGRHWQCKDVAMDGRAMCEKHYYQIIERNKRKAEEALFSQKSSNDKQKLQYLKTEVTAKKKKSKTSQSPIDSTMLPEPAKVISVREVKTVHKSKGSKLDFERNYASKPLAVSMGVKRKKKQYLKKNTLEDSLVRSFLRKKNGQAVSGAFPKGAQSRSAKSIELTCSKKLRHLKYLLAWILPYLKDVNNEQNRELAVEDNLKGKNPSNVERASVEADEQIACDNCGTSIVDFHRRCSNCDFNLCLACCHELRKNLNLGSIEGGCHLRVEDESLSVRAKSNTGGPLECLAQEGAVDLQPFRVANPERKSHCFGQSLGKKVCQNGSILCLRGCECFFMQLRRIYKRKLLEKLEVEVEGILGDQMFVKKEFQHCSIRQSKEDLTVKENNFRLAAYRKDSNDNQLFCPTSSEMKNEGLEHFQTHWLNGEPIIVKGVLAVSSGLSWEPKHMWHSLRKMSKGRIKGKRSVVAIDAANGKEVEINLLQFFAGFERGCISEDGHPVILKLKDWPPIDSFEEFLSYYEAEFINLLPLHIYTNPKTGLLNLASKLPMALLKPELHAKTCIGYGVPEELDVGVAETLLHCEMSDVVNLLVHASEVTGPVLKCRRVQLEKLNEEDCRYFSEKLLSFMPVKIFMDSVEPMMATEVLRGNSDNSDGGASFMVNKARKSQLSSPSSTVSDVSLKSEVAALETERLPSIGGGANEESPDTGRLSLIAQVIKTSSEKLEEIVSKDQTVSAGTDNVTGNKTFESGMKDEGTLWSEKLEESVSRKQIMSAGVDSIIGNKIKSGVSRGGTLWDIFRREDVPKLKTYLIKHTQDFNQNANELTAKVVNPILDQKFYLSEKHKRKLKEEFRGNRALDI